MGVDGPFLLNRYYTLFYYGGIQSRNRNKLSILDYILISLKQRCTNEI